MSVCRAEGKGVVFLQNAVKVLAVKVLAVKVLVSH